MDMNLIIGSGRTHAKTLSDAGTGVEIRFTYRLPTNAERVAYEKAATKFTGRGKMVIKAGEAARKAVLPLLEEFEFPSGREHPETTIRMEKHGQEVPISSGSGEPGYLPNWRQMLDKAVPHMIQALGSKVFAGLGDDEGRIEVDYGVSDVEDEAYDEGGSSAPLEAPED